MVLLQDGTLIAGRYEIHAPLASGGNGLVFVATDLTTEKRVAVKVLGMHLLHERAAREKLRLEAIVAGRVESEHIVQVSDAGIDVATGTPFLVMELLKGLDLQHHVEQQGPLEFSLALEYLRQVASGLDKAHGWKDRDGRAAPIVHRDLKPENLFLTYREDGSPLVKILDFGLAKVLSVSATLSSEVRGTPLYMAPEQLLQAPVTPATDIWAIGLVAFFLLTGKCYWLSAQNDRAVLPAVIKEVTDGIIRPASVRARDLGVSVSLPEAFDAWFEQCVNLDPARRFVLASTAVKALSVALEQPLVSSSLASQGAIPQRASRHSMTDVTSVAAVAGRPSATLAVASDTERRKGIAVFKYVGAALVLVVAILLVFAMRQHRMTVPEAAPQTAQASVEIQPVALDKPALPVAEQTPTAAQPAAAANPSTTGATAASSNASTLSATHRQEKATREPTVASSAAARPRSSSGASTSLSRPKTAIKALTPPKVSSGAPTSAVPVASTREGTQTRVPRDPADHR
jgi:eukaryotic-like serine/threonine-protein kinase